MCMDQIVRSVVVVVLVVVVVVHIVGGLRIGVGVVALLLGAWWVGIRVVMGYGRLEWGLDRLEDPSLHMTLLCWFGGKNPRVVISWGLMFVRCCL